MSTFPAHRWQPVLGIAAALAVLALAIGFTRAQLRTEVRQQLARRDGQILGSLLRREIDRRADDEFADPLLAALDAALVPEVPGLEAIRLHDPDGWFFAALMGPTNAVSLAPGTLARLDAGATVTEFEDRPGAPVRVLVPLSNPRGPGRLGIVVYELDGGPLAAEFAELDAHLGRQALLAFLLAGGATTAALAWAFHRLATANRLLAARTRLLERANAELTLATKTSAVGAVASHLVHGLKNPVLALQQFVAAQGAEPGGDWQDAADTAGRLRRMIDEVVRVLREEQHLAGFEIPPADIASALIHRMSPVAAARDIRLEAGPSDGPPLPNREANLVLLILENLLTNALQAAPPGGRVLLGFEAGPESWTWRVVDDGPGIPADRRPHLFRPGHTTKPGGTGLGLALSRQLARHLGGDLELEPDTGRGTGFRLTVPAHTPIPVATP